MNRSLGSGLDKMNDSYAEVNRLIIIGNGFDLAHRLKSSFKHFVDDYLYKVLKRLSIEFMYNDEILYFDINGGHFNPSAMINTLTETNALGYFKYLMEMDESPVRWKSTLFNSIVEHSEIDKWVDIEMIYFEQLSKASSSTEAEVINKLNDELDLIKGKLCDYLSSELKNCEPEISQGIIEQITQPIKVSQTKPMTIKSDKDVSSYCFLNFNYTKIARLYYDKIATNSNYYIPIHGQLPGHDLGVQDPIFGFGDELDKEYMKFEDMNNDELLKHIKSFKYLQSNSYRTMLEFIESKPFQVHIYGHSCGLSDRTLLNTIFEHKNCISIKPFYYEWEDGDDYEQKSFAISRNFKSKAELRARVVGKPDCEPMAQPSK